MTKIQGFRSSVQGLGFRGESVGFKDWGVGGRVWRFAFIQGYLAHKKQPPPLGPPYDLRNSPTLGSYEGGVSYE